MKNSITEHVAGGWHKRLLGMTESLLIIILLLFPAGISADDDTPDISDYTKIASFYFTSDMYSGSSSTTTGSSTDNCSTYVSVTDCSVSWSKIGGSKNSEEVDSKYYYKLTSDDSYLTITLTDGKFEAGDVVTMDVCSSNTSAIAYYLKSTSGNTISVTPSAKETACTAYYTLTSDDIDDAGSITFYRNGTNGYIYGAAVYRDENAQVNVSASSSEVETNGSFTLTATAKNIADGTTITYQWYKASSTTVDNDTKIDNATSSTLSTSESTVGTYYYYCTATYTTGTTTEESTEETDVTASSDDDSSDGDSGDSSETTTTTLTSNVVSVSVVNVMAASISTTSTVGETATSLDATTVTDDSGNSIDIYYIDATGTATTTATVTNKSSTATLYYYLGSAVNSNYSSDGTDWTAYSSEDGITVSITDTVSYLTVAAVRTVTGNDDSSTTYTAYTYAKYAYDLSSGTLSFDKDDAISTAAISNTDGYSLGVKMMFTPDDSETKYDVTSKVGLSYSSGDATIATVDANGTVKGVSVGTVNIKVTLTHAGNYSVSKKDTTYVTVSVLSAEVPVITLSDESKNYTYTKDNTAYRFSGDVSSVKAVISLPSGTDTDSHQIFYTLDGSIPTWKSAKIDNGGDVTINVTSYLFAVQYSKQTDSEGNTVYRNPGSVAMASFHLPSTKTRAFTDGLEINAGDTMKIESSDGEDVYLLATLGSPDDSSVWSETKQDGKMLNSELGSYHYATIGQKDANNEPKTLYKTTEATRYNPTLSGGTNEFDIPICGSYIKFEPKRDGDINVVIRQNGIIADDTDVDNTNVSKRYVYVCDEAGQPVDSLKALINPNALQNTDLYTEFNSHTVSTDYQDNFLFYQKLLYYKYVEKNGYVFKDASGNEMTSFSADSWADDSVANAKKFWYGSSDGDTLITSKDSDGTVQTDESGNIKYENLGDTVNMAIKQMPYNILYKADDYGWIVMSKAYVRYSFPVEAGKTYFIMGRATKIGACGFSFHPRLTDDEYTAFMGTSYTTDDSSDTTDDSDGDGTSSTSSERLITIDGETAYGEDGYPTSLTKPSNTTYTYNGTEYKSYGQCNIKLTRTFDKDMWTSLVLPFSVSPTMVESIFGEGTQIIHFNGTDDTELKLMKHYHQMIVAGTPVFICPTQTVENPKFEDVTYGQSTFGRDETTNLWYVKSVSSPVSVTSKEDTCQCWEITGSYLPAETGSNVYLMAYKRAEGDDGNVTTSANSLYHYTTKQSLAGTRAWLEYIGSETGAKLTSVSVNNIEDLDEEETTGILNAVLGTETVAAYKNNTYIYNMSGQVVRKADEGTQGLAKGVYIINGKKVVIK